MARYSVQLRDQKFSKRLQIFVFLLKYMVKNFHKNIKKLKR